MGLFGKSEVEVGAPTMGALRYRGSAIELRPPEIPYPGPGTFQLAAAQHLERIERTVGLGDDLIQALMRSGRSIKIKYGTLNWARVGMGGLFELCYQYFNNNSSPQADERPARNPGQYREFADELRNTMTRGGYTPQLLAERLSRATLYSWTDGVAAEYPFMNGPARMSVEQIRAKVEAWVAGDLYPSTAQWDLASKALEPFLRTGEGSNVLISYDPLNDVGRPAHVGLFHELVHAYYSATGTQLGMEDSASENGTGRHFEQQSCGFAPHDSKPFSENRYRQAVGCPKRVAY
jgi:Effector protein